MKKNITEKMQCVPPSLGVWPRGRANETELRHMYRCACGRGGGALTREDAYELMMKMMGAAVPAPALANANSWQSRPNPTPTLGGSRCSCGANSFLWATPRAQS